MRSETNANRPMRLREAGDALGLSVRTIRAWIAKKSSGHIRLGGAIRILPSDIQELYEAPRFPLECQATARMEHGQR
jgi:excisionase family DNA binding protein